MFESFIFEMSKLNTTDHGSSDDFFFTEIYLYQRGDRRFVIVKFSHHQFLEIISSVPHVM